MNRCVFCEISSGSIPADVVIENDLVIAVMDINPVSPGHILVIPKAHSSDITQTEEVAIVSLSKILQKIGKAQIDRLGATGFNILSANGKSAQQSVFHTHFHVVPRYTNDGLDLWFQGKSKLAMTQKESFSLLIAGEADANRT